MPDPNNANNLFELVNYPPWSNGSAEDVAKVTIEFQASSHTYALNAFALDKNSLNDGEYHFIIPDLNPDPPAISHFVPPFNFHRYFGDVDGDGDSDQTDYGSFRAFFSLYDYSFDYDGDGDVDPTDLGQFRLRFGGNV